VDRTLEAVKGVFHLAHDNIKRVGVLIAASLALSHDVLRLVPIRVVCLVNSI
jgi:hypothetical protein